MAGQVVQGGHKVAGEGRRLHCASLCHAAGYREGDRGILPEIHRRGLEEGNQGHPHGLRSVAHCRRPAPVRAEKVRWSVRPFPFPEVLPVRPARGTAGSTLASHAAPAL